MSLGRKVAIGAGSAFAFLIVLGLIGNAIGDRPTNVASSSSTAGRAPASTEVATDTATTATSTPSVKPTASSAPASKPSTPAPAGLDASCTATPAGEFGLTRVEVEPAAGHPDGAKNVRWTTNTPIPQSGKVSFTLTSGSIMRGVSYLDGRLIANYVYSMKTAKQDNITIPPRLTGNELAVVIPAASAPDLGKTWSADLEIDAHSTGKCKP